MSVLKGPPRYVPTLTEVVGSTSLDEPVFTDAAANASAGSADKQELMARRILQHTELMIDRRLHDALAQLILEHTQAMMPRLREEIELVVRESVAEAFEQETPLYPDFPRAMSRDQA